MAGRETLKQAKLRNEPKKLFEINVSNKSRLIRLKTSEWRARLFVAQTSVFEVCGVCVRSKTADRESGGLRYREIPKIKKWPGGNGLNAQNCGTNPSDD